MTDLAQILAIARRHPWYRDGASGASLADWPVLRKADLYAKLEASRAVGTGDTGGIYYSRSGGTTTRSSLFFPVDVAENHRQRRLLARRLRADRVLGAESIVLNVFPAVRMYRAMEIFTEIAERCGATVLPMAALAPDDELCEMVKDFGANTLMGMPSRLIGLARFFQDHGLEWNPRTVLFGGEFLQPGKRRLLQEILGVERIAGVYGSAELGVVAWHPGTSVDTVYHFPADILHMEVADPDADGFGALVATSLVRQRFPIIRYDTGDVGRILGRIGDVTRVELRGRDADSFLIGDNYHSLVDFAKILEDFVEFQIQIRFDDAFRQDVIRFCLVPRVIRITEEKQQSTIRELERILEPHEVMFRLEVDFVPAGALIRTGPSQKTPPIVDTRGR